MSSAWASMPEQHRNLYFKIGILFYELDILEENNYYYWSSRATENVEDGIKNAIDRYRDETRR